MISTVALIFILIISGIMVCGTNKFESKKTKEPTLHERQITFFKDHQDEMTAYIEKELPGENDIKCYWDSVETVNGVLFSQPSLSVDFDDSNHLIEDPTNKVPVHRAIYIHTDVYKLKTIEEMHLFYPNGKGANNGRIIKL